MFVFLGVVHAQENHYWEQQVGAIPNMIGGAATANARDNSAIYYNPGGLAFVDNSSLSLVGDAFVVSSLVIENGAGAGKNLRSLIANTTPQIVSGILKNRKNPDLSVTYAIINNNSSLINMNLSHEMYYDILPGTPGEEIYVANYDYYNKTREDWLGIGMGHKLGEHFGIGFSYFLTLRSQDLSRSYNAHVLEYFPVADLTSSLASSSFREVFEYRNLGMLWKFGTSFEKGSLKLGLTVTTPKLNVELLNGSLRRDLITRIPPGTIISPIVSADQQKVPTIHKLPLNIDLGADYEFGATSVSARMGYAHKIASYALLRPESPRNEIQGILDTGDERFQNMRDASRSLLNFGFGVIHVIQEGWAVLGGYRTDFNYFNEEDLSRQDNYVPSISYWDLHHLSGGFTRYGERYFLSLGISFGFGRSQGFQEVNLTEPSLENYLFGMRDQSAYAKYNQLSINLGFTYLFER